VLLLGVLAGIVAAPSARASAAKASGGNPTAVLSAAFRPKRLGAATTLVFSVRIDPPAQSTPLPVSEIEISYPANLGLATSGLGLDSCDPAALELQGTEACPANSKLGEGSAVVEVPFGPTIVSEPVALEIYAVPSSDGFLHLGILAHGQTPVIANVVLSGVLSSGRLQITVPPIASLPAAPFVALVKMQASLGGDLTYFEQRGGRKVAYRPRGIGLPDSCPRGGWRLGARFQFTNGQSSAAKTAISCPARARAKGR
jgi:hypothetical protein